jgi:hypothetical protein
LPAVDDIKLTVMPQMPWNSDKSEKNNRKLL